MARLTSAMALRCRLAVPVAILLVGCNSLSVNRGLPVIEKPADAVLIAGVGGLPDLERGNQALLAGRLEDAQRDLLPLARRGYADAQLYLAAVYAHGLSADAEDQAIKWYRAAAPHRETAVIPLARIYMRRGDRASVLEAERLLLEARRRAADPAIDAALLDLYGLYPEFDAQARAPALALIASRSTLPDSRSAALSWYRASVSDAAQAGRLVNLCRESLDLVPYCFVDLAYYHRYSGDKQALDQLVTQAMRSFQRAEPEANFDSLELNTRQLPAVAGRLALALIEQPAAEEVAETNEQLEYDRETELLVETQAQDEGVDAVAPSGALPQYLPDAAAPSIAVTEAPASEPASNSPGAAVPELADRLLRWMLSVPGAMPVEAAGVAVAYPYLLPDVDLEAVLTTGIAAGVPEASLYLGQLYFFNQRLPRQASRVETNLKRSLQFRETAAAGHYRLGRLYQQGYLGTPDPQQSLDNFLYAARHRVTAADTHLARLFYDTPGARIDRINSYVFARLAGDAGSPVFVHSLRGGVLNSYKLLDRLHAELTAEELKQAQATYRQEKVVHLVMRPRAAPSVWAEQPK